MKVLRRQKPDIFQEAEKKKKIQLEIAHAFVPEHTQMLACSLGALTKLQLSVCSFLRKQPMWRQLSSAGPATLSLTLTVVGSFVTGGPRLQEGGLPGCGQTHLCAS